MALWLVLDLRSRGLRLEPGPPEALCCIYRERHLSSSLRRPSSYHPGNYSTMSIELTLGKNTKPEKPAHNTFERL